MDAWKDSESALRIAISRNMELRKPPIHTRGGFLSQDERGCSCLKQTIALVLVSILALLVVL